MFQAKKWGGSLEETLDTVYKVLREQSPSVDADKLCKSVREELPAVTTDKQHNTNGNSSAPAKPTEMLISVMVYVSIHVQPNQMQCIPVWQVNTVWTVPSLTTCVLEVSNDI